MKKTKLALTALMIGTMSLTGVAFAEASVLDSVKLVLNIGTEKAPPRQEKPEPPRQPEHKPAPKPVMEHGPKQEPRPPERKPATTHEPQRGPRQEPEGQPRPEQREGKPR